MRSSRILLSALAATTALVLSSASTAAAGTLDQEQTSSVTNAGLFPTQTPAQTFTAGISGALDQVDLLLFKVGTPPAPVTVEIRNTSAGQPGTAVLDTASLPISAIGTTQAFVPVTFATPASVTAGTQYAVVAYTPGTAGNTVGWLYQNTGNLYSPGAMFVSNDPLPPGGNWNLSGGPPGDDDLGFKTYVVPAPPVVTPPTTAKKKKCKKKKKKSSSAESAKKKKCKKKKKK